MRYAPFAKLSLNMLADVNALLHMG